jgi:hypothetical protein
VPPHRCGSLRIHHEQLWLHDYLKELLDQHADSLISSFGATIAIELAKLIEGPTHYKNNTLTHMSSVGNVTVVPSLVTGLNNEFQYHLAAYFIPDLSKNREHNFLGLILRVKYL